MLAMGEMPVGASAVSSPIAEAVELGTCRTQIYSHAECILLSAWGYQPMIKGMVYRKARYDHMRATNVHPDLMFAGTYMVASFHSGPGFRLWAGHQVINWLPVSTGH